MSNLKPEALKPETLSQFSDIQLLQMIVDIVLESPTILEATVDIAIIAHELDRRDYEFET